MDELLAEIRSRHFPNAPVSEAAIESFERSNGIVLPDDMRSFYACCDGAELFRAEPDDPPFRLMRLSELTRARVAIYGEDGEEYGPSSDFVFCDVLDGNFAAIQLESKSANFGRIIDCFHETYPDPDYLTVIASSFSEFLKKALHSSGSYMDLL